MKKSVYMVGVLALLAIIALVSFIVDKKIKEEEQDMTEETAQGDTSLTVYGELSKVALVSELQNSVVQIEVKVTNDSGTETTILGSGVILEVTDDYVDIATASHVVELTAKPLVYFNDGNLAYGSVLAYGKLSDVAFIRINAADMSMGTETYKAVVCADNDDYAVLATEDMVYMVGSATTVSGDVKEGSIKETEQFVELFQNDMLVCETAVSAGMSGGGTFDETGKCIGVIVGTSERETVSVAITDVLSEYRSISQ